MSRTRTAFVLLLLGVAQLGSAASVAEYPLPQRLTLPSGIVFTADGRGWISTFYGGILRFNLDGSFSQIGDGSRLYYTLLAGPDGAVWTARAGELLRIDPVTSVLEVINSGDYINGLTTGADGALWLLRRDSNHVHHIVRIDPSGVVLSTVSTNLGLAAGLRNLSIASDGTMWTPAGDGVVRVNATGEISTFPLSFSGYWIFSGTDSVWIVGAQSVARVGLAGDVLAQYQFPKPFVGATTDAEANLWLIEESTGSVIRISPLGVQTHYGRVPDRPADCQPGIPVPLSITPDGRVAGVKWFLEDNNYAPFGRCVADPRGTDSLFLVNPAQHAAVEVPTAGLLSLAALVILIALVGATRIPEL